MESLNKNTIGVGLIAAAIGFVIGDLIQRVRIIRKYSEIVRLDEQLNELVDALEQAEIPH